MLFFFLDTSGEVTKAWVAGFASLRPVKFLLYDVTIVLASPFLTSCLQRQTNRSSLLVYLSWNWSCKYTVQILVQLVVQSTIKLILTLIWL